MFPKDPADININANQSGVLEVMEYFLKQKLIFPGQEENKQESGGKKKLHVKGK